MKKIANALFSLFVVLVIAVVSGAMIYYDSYIPTSAKYDSPNTVIIDPGHGGFDGGAVASDGTVEKDINLQISLKVAKMLEFSGYNVIMTRTDDTGTEDDDSISIPKRKKSDLSNRLKIMDNNPNAIYVSIHLNKFTTSAANGAQVFYTKNYKQAQTLAKYLQSNIKDMLQPENTRVVKQGTDSTYLLKNATVPAVIVECGFLSNSAECEKLKSAEYQSQMAFAIFGGIINYFEN